MANENGEIRAQARMVVCANSELCGKKYEILKDLNIAEITQEALLNAIEPFLAKDKIIEMQETTKSQTIKQVLEKL